MHRDDDLTVVRRSKAPHPTVWLEVTYTGTTPPLDLFADLEMIGWRPPVPAAPPATAIDWSSPNAETGERFTIQAWRVEGAVVEPPKGSGPRGHWTAADRQAFLLGLEGVLRRHGLVEPEPEPEPVPAASEASLPPPPVSAPTTTAAIAEHGATLPAPEAPPPLAPAPAPGGITTVVRASVIPPTRRPAVAEALAPLGVPVHFAVVNRTVSNTYRGTTYETTAEVLEVEVLVDDRLAEITSAVLRDLGLTPEQHAAPNDLPAPAVVSGESDTDPAIDMSVELALTVEEPLAAQADSALRPFATGGVDVESTTMQIVNTYRGTSYERTVPAVRVRAVVDTARVDEAADSVAGALGIDRSRVERIVVAPEAAPDPRRGPVATPRARITEPAPGVR